MIGRDLRELREAAGLSQRQVANTTGGVISAAGLSRIERGQRYPSLRTLEALTSALSIRITVEGGRASVEVAS